MATVALTRLCELGPAGEPAHVAATSISPMAAVDAAVADVRAALQRLEVAMATRDTAVPQSVAGLRAVERVASLIEARRHVLTVQAAGTEPVALSHRTPGGRDSRISDIRAVELGALLGCSADRARTLAHRSRAVCLELPDVLRHLDEGLITAYHCVIALDGWRELENRWLASGHAMPDDTASRYQARILDAVARRTVSEYRRRVTLAVSLLAPKVPDAAHQAACEQRCVTLSPAGDGMAWLTAYLETAQAASVMHVLEQAARCDTTLTGNQQQRTADALVAIVTGRSELSPSSRVAAAEVHLLVSADALASGALAGQISGSDLLVEGDALRDLMADAKFRRLLIDGDGRLLDFDRTTYRPPTQLADHVVARDRSCRAPGCGRPARYTDLDHIEPWNEGGVTADHNLAALCRTHHVLKTHGGWQYRRDPDGTTLWRLPSGATASRPPADYAEHTPPF